MKRLLLIFPVIVLFAVGCKKDKPIVLATLTTVTATSITANTAQSGGDITADGGAAVMQRGVCYATHSAPTVSDSVTKDGSGTGTFTSNLSGLLPYTTYYIRAYAVNSTGTSYGNEISFVTSKGSPAVTTTAISNNQNLTAVSGGTVTTDGGANVTARGICWSTSHNPTTTDSKTVDGTGTGSFTDTIYGLNLNTYYVRAYATNSYGTTYGNEVSFAVSATGTIADVDGNTYTTVMIGTQTWMASNLRTSHYLNGDPIINGLATNFDWWGNFLNYTYAGAYTFPEGDSTNDARYGKLYNNYVVDDNRGVCPTGWHVPNEDDWNTLEYYEGVSASDTSQANGSIGNIAPKLLEGGSSGLNLQLAGGLFIAGANNYTYNRIETLSAFWSAKTYNSGRLGNYYRKFTAGDSSIYRGYNFQYGFSIRCVKD